MMRLPRAALAAATALLLLVPVEAAAIGRGDRWRTDPAALPTVYRLDPNGQADPHIFPEGVAADATTFYVGSTTDGTVYRGSLREETATPFLLPGEDGRTSAVGMKLAGRTLFVAGGPTGRVWAYDTGAGDLIGSWTVANPTDAANPTFLNDLVVTRNGDVYVTDSRRPVLYRIPADGRATDGVAPLEVFREYAGTPIVYGTGFNVGGIAATPDGTTLILAQSNTRQLFRVLLADKSIVRIDLGGELVGADGLVLRGRRDLSAVERQGDVGYVVEIRLDRELDAGRVDSRTSDATFNDPTTAARVGGSLLVVNSQFGERNANVPPTLPFTVSRVGIR